MGNGGVDNSTLFFEVRGNEKERKGKSPTFPIASGAFGFTAP